MSRWVWTGVALGAAAAIAALHGVADATETINYSYDAQGRLIAVAHSGTVNNGLNVQYGQDAANNRTTVTVSGAPSK